MKPLAPIFTKLRGQILTLTPGHLKLAPTPDLPHVWAAFMDMSVSDSVASLLASAEGTSSLYFGTGGGIIGAGKHPQVRAANRRFLVALDAALDALSPVAEAALPAAGHVAFAVLTYDGLRGAQVAEDILKAGGHPLSKSFMAGHELIAYLRAASEAAANAKRQPTDPRH
ncbi:MAG TPA: hypothetical protein VLI88_02225 [Patescibacteria group bacterium]|jgi:hypothetical protein|nr:hypothetical protein [Patescibacteria group bacterium]